MTSNKIQEFETGNDLNEISNNFLKDRFDITETERKQWKLIMTEKEIGIGLNRVARVIDKQFQDETKPVVVLGVLRGCIVFLSDLIKRLQIPYQVDVLSASSYQDAQTQQNHVAVHYTFDMEKYKDNKIIVLDELADNGKTLQSIKNELIVGGIPESNITTCVLFRKNKDTKFPRPDIVGLDSLPNLWMVGYGLDRNQELRGWPLLYATPKLPGVPTEPDDKIFEESEEAEKEYIKLRKRVIACLSEAKQYSK
eukprot:gb/GECH01000905.1/.p1 GENE.gb/GECH01000905.1/~~gb/GECH01000905.1/.p1  ORF type:complete len:253 (+),score=68.26 gb/GECH01000905.1/:1-759(+)